MFSLYGSCPLEPLSPCLMHLYFPTDLEHLECSIYTDSVMGLNVSH